MKRILLLFPAVILTVVLCSGMAAEAQPVTPGEEAFLSNCAVCHANGENLITPSKSLHKKSLAANGIRTADDIVKKMRDPGPGMTKFDAEMIPDKMARQIAEYILKKF